MCDEVMSEPELLPALLSSLSSKDEEAQVGGGGAGMRKCGCLFYGRTQACVKACFMVCTCGERVVV